MKRYLILILACVICFTACADSVDAEKDAILFGNSLSDVAATYGYTEADALSVAKSDEYGTCYDVYAFDGAAFGDLTANVLLLGKSYQLDEDGKQWDLGISSIEYRFSEGKFGTYQDFIRQFKWFYRRIRIIINLVKRNSSISRMFLVRMIGTG